MLNEHSPVFVGKTLIELVFIVFSLEHTLPHAPLTSCKLCSCVEMRRVFPASLSLRASSLHTPLDDVMLEVGVSSFKRRAAVALSSYVYAYHNDSFPAICYQPGSAMR
jgi:hypothetical protein